jgi:lipopolysaccharide export system permease protein
VKILTKYVLKEHLGPFVFASTAMTSLMLLQFVGKRLGDLVGKGLPWRVLLEFFVLSMPLTVAVTLPMAVLVAVLYAYSRLASENEITAMRANGISMRALMIPTIAAGVVVALAMLLFNDQVLSRANHQLAVLQNDIARTKPSFALKEQIINTVVDQKLYLRASRIDRGTQHMKDVVIYDVSNPAHRRTIYANNGTLGVAPNGTDLVLHLYDGHMVEVPTQHQDQMTRMYFTQDLLRVQNVTNSFQATDADSASKSDREMSVCEMQTKLADVDLRWREAQYDRLRAQAELLKANGEQNIQWPTRPAYRNPFGLGSLYCGLVKKLFGVKTASAATLPPRGGGGAAVAVAAAVPQQPAQQQRPESAAARPVPPSAGDPILRQLPQGQAGVPGPRIDRIQLQGAEESARAREQVMKYQRIRYDIEIQKKFSLAAACIIFVLLGPPIALRFPRGGVGLVIGVSFAVFALYYVGLIGGEPLANSQFISPFWAMWSDNLVLFVVGVVMSLRMNRVGGSARGGDWSELRDFLVTLGRRMVGRPRRTA